MFFHGYFSSRRSPRVQSFTCIPESIKQTKLAQIESLKHLIAEDKAVITQIKTDVKAKLRGGLHMHRLVDGLDASTLALCPGQLKQLPDWREGISMDYAS
jgi:hypothetical protein